MCADIGGYGNNGNNGNKSIKSMFLKAVLCFHEWKHEWKQTYRKPESLGPSGGEAIAGNSDRD